MKSIFSLMLFFAFDFAYGRTDIFSQVESLLADGDVEKAIEVVEMGDLNIGEPVRLSLLANIHLRSSKFRKATQISRKAIAEAPTYDWPRIILVKALISRKKYTSANKQIALLREIDDSHNPDLLKAELLMVQGQYRKADKWFSKAVVKNRDKNILEVRSWNRTLWKKERKAESDLLTSHRIDDNDSRILLALANHYNQRGLDGYALHYLEKAIDVCSRSNNCQDTSNIYSDSFFNVGNKKGYQISNNLFVTYYGSIEDKPSNKENLLRAEKIQGVPVGSSEMESYRNSYHRINLSSYPSKNLNLYAQISKEEVLDENPVYLEPSQNKARMGMNYYLPNNIVNNMKLITYFEKTQINANDVILLPESISLEENQIEIEELTLGMNASGLFKSQDLTILISKGEAESLTRNFSSNLLGMNINYRQLLGSIWLNYIVDYRDGSIKNDNVKDNRLENTFSIENIYERNSFLILLSSIDHKDIVNRANYSTSMSLVKFQYTRRFSNQWIFRYGLGRDFVDRGYSEYNQLAGIDLVTGFKQIVHETNETKFSANHDVRYSLEAVSKVEVSDLKERRLEFKFSIQLGV